ncbi:hypothetical protein Tco_1040699, partial [Tanacetum coccineum]
VVVVRFPDGEVGSPSRVDHDGSGGGLYPVPEEEPDASDKQTGMMKRLISKLVAAAFLLEV